MVRPITQASPRDAPAISPHYSPARKGTLSIRRRDFIALMRRRPTMKPRRTRMVRPITQASPRRTHRAISPNYSPARKGTLSIRRQAPSANAVTPHDEAKTHPNGSAHNASITAPNAPGDSAELQPSAQGQAIDPTPGLHSANAATPHDEVKTHPNGSAHDCEHLRAERTRRFRRTTAQRARALGISPWKRRYQD